MSASAWAVQQAIYEALSAALSVPVYDAPVPPEMALPYVTIDTLTIADWSTTKRAGEELNLTLSVWSVQRGKKEALGLMAAVKAALHDRALAVAGYGAVMVREDFAEIFMDQDGITQHGVARYRVVVQAAA